MWPPCLGFYDILLPGMTLRKDGDESPMTAGKTAKPGRMDAIQRRRIVTLGQPRPAHQRMNSEEMPPTWSGVPQGYNIRTRLTPATVAESNPPYALKIIRAIREDP